MAETAVVMDAVQNIGLGLTIAKQFLERMVHEIHASMHQEGALRILSVKIYCFF